MGLLNILWLCFASLSRWRCGWYHETVKLLSLLEEPDIVSWNIVIAACAHNGYYKEVFELFKHMRTAHILPDNYTLVSLLSTSTKFCNLALGSSLHGLIIKTNINCHDTFLCNVLIDMYGCTGSSVKLFDRMTDRNLITWTALISTLGLNGFAHDAVKTFREMELQGFKPDRVAFIAVLTACRHGGLVREGKELFGQMKKSYGTQKSIIITVWWTYWPDVDIIRKQKNDSHNAFPTKCPHMA